MDHISANLGSVDANKNIWGYKSSRGGGGQEAYKKNRKKSCNLFFVLFWRQ